MGIRMQEGIEQPLVSVIIPTYNSGRFMAKCLESLRGQAWKKMEVIVVDDGSTDTTFEIAEKYKCDLIRNPRRGRAEAKNEGMRRSSGEYLLFVDSDMELARNVIGECVERAVEDQDIGGVVIPERSVGSSFWVKARDFERGFYSGSIVESARFFPAELVKEVGGFEEGLIFFEESTLPYKILRETHRVFPRIKSVILHHEEDFSLATWLRKKFHYGKTVHLYASKYGDYSIMQMSIWSRYALFLKNWRSFLSKPKLALGVTLLKSLEYFATTSGLVYSKLKL
jgi:glycosyltransferase involved in cell wall biosynthesis